MSKKTTSENKPWNPQAVNGAQNTLNSTVAGAAPQLAQNAATINNQLPGLASRAFAPDPTITAAQGYDQNVLNGQYLGAGNPYMNNMIDQTNRGVTDQVNSQFGLGGRTGSDQHAQVLSRSLADADNSLRYGNYGQERGYMGQAAAMAPGLNAGQYAGVDPTLQAAQTGSQIPYLGANALAQNTANLQGRFNTTTQTQSPLTTLGNIAGLGMMAFGGGGPLAGVFKSDRRLKTNIAKVGEHPDGLGVYDYAYKDEPTIRFRGVMADEVAKIRPWALGPTTDDGFATVNYARL